MFITSPIYILQWRA